MPPPQVIAADVSPGLDPQLTIGFVGDTMVGDGALKLVAKRGVAAPLAKVSGLLNADFVIANHEAPLSIRPSTSFEKRFNYAGLPMSAQALRVAGVDALSLSNNHVMDRGVNGLIDTRKYARQVGLLNFGAGMNRADAERPLVLRSPGQTVAVVAFSEDYGQSSRSSETDPGTVTLNPARIIRGYQLAKAAGADRVVALVHWGDNYLPVNAEQRYWAGQLVAAGFDAVVGSGPHIVQPVELIGGKPVLWSLGNFVFGAPGRFESFKTVGRGLVANLGWSAAGQGMLTLRCLVTDNRRVKYVARECTPIEAAKLYPTLSRWLTVTGCTAYLAC